MKDGTPCDNDSQLNAAQSIAILRASMVPIVNVMNEFDQRVQQSEECEKVRDGLLQSLDDEVDKCVHLGVETVLKYHREWQQLQSTSSENSFVIGTFSRSSTMKSILNQVLQTIQSEHQVKVICSQSSPGDEGELMAKDTNAKCLSDQSFQQRIQAGKMNLVLVGADCILQNGSGVVNKVGTAALATCCKQASVSILSVADKWKLWEDEYPPGLEDIFELVPSDLLDQVLVP